MLRRLSIPFKLSLLAGVPVIGALVLATLIVLSAQRQAAGAAALGDVDALAKLAARMANVVDAVQSERSELALRLGLKTPRAPELDAIFRRTDAAVVELGTFVTTTKQASLPPRLARDLERAHADLQRLSTEREALSKSTDLDQLMLYYGGVNRSLINATAALAQLSDDGQLMRAIDALVALQEVKERRAQVRALLSNVFAIKEFPPGSYKGLVTLLTEEAAYGNVLEVNATDKVRQRFRDASVGPESERTASLLKLALESTSDDFEVDAREWFDLKAQQEARMRSLELALSNAVRDAALAKLSDIATSVRISYSLAGGVVLISLLLAALVGRGIARSVRNLSEAAHQVTSQQDFSIRAQKTSEDELGALTDAFNGMLSGIQHRDRELGQHREHLEDLVEQRSAALRQRNQAMRVVLDHVEQGLATILPSGELDTERSRLFDVWFGGTAASDTFSERLGGTDARLRLGLQMAWEQVTDGLLPLEVAIGQLPSKLAVCGRHYTLEYKALLDDEVLNGILLVVSDVTDALRQRAVDADQREQLAILKHIAENREAFFEFFRDAEALVRTSVDATQGSTPPRLRAIHTLKGNCGILGIHSLEQAAHALEDALKESAREPIENASKTLTDAWDTLANRVGGLSGGHDVFEVTRAELLELERAVSKRAPQAVVMDLVRRWSLERGVVRLRRVSEQAKALATRLNKNGLQVEVSAQGDVRLQRESWAPFWSAFVHALRNALDHGIETQEERTAAGKTPFGNLRLSMVVDQHQLTLELADDGRGIGWNEVREMAQMSGLPHATHPDLVAALFSDGLSTAGQATEVSGRGVGMGALREATRALNGSVDVLSTPGRGTTLRFLFDLTDGAGLIGSPTLPQFLV